MVSDEFYLTYIGVKVNVIGGLGSIPSVMGAPSRMPRPTDLESPLDIKRGWDIPCDYEAPSLSRVKRSSLE